MVGGAAGAGDGRRFVFGMDFCFHGWKREVETTGPDGGCNLKDVLLFVTDSSSKNALLVAWSATLARLGDKPAIFHPNGAVACTFREIESEARDFADALAGLPRGAVVGVQIGNSPSWPAVLLSLFRREQIPLPLGRHMEAAELQIALATCGVAAVVTVESDQLRVEPQSTRQAPQWSEPVPDFLKLTSGTTSAPRAIRFRARQLLADAENICATMGITDRDLNFGVIPFSHSYGFSNLLTPLLAFGVPLVASEDRMPRAILHDLAASGATVFPGMPVFFQKLAELENRPALPRLRLCISAGAPLSHSVAGRFREKFGLDLHTFYGASECGGIGYDSAGRGGEEGFVGIPMRGVEVIPPESGDDGPIEVRSEAVGDGYFPVAADEPVGAGRFVPSDLVRWTERGMCIVGRASDVINVAGRKLNPGEIEHRLGSCPGVKQVVVFGVPSALRGEEPVACVVAAPGTDAAALLRFCSAELSSWQSPKDIWMLDEIPTNERGKISRRGLAELYRNARR